MTPRRALCDAEGMSLAERLERAGFRGRLEPEAPLAPLTTWRIGGPAELLATPCDRADLELACGWACAEGIGWRVLGNGSNLLVRDAGVRGLVLRLRRVLDEIDVQGTSLTAGAGASFPAVVRYAAARGLAGIEFGAGIPGTIGGAIVMNAGWHEFEIGNVVRCVDALEPDGAVRSHATEACGFRYRSSRFRDGTAVVVRTTLELQADDPAEISSRLEHFAESRKANQPTELPSCGSVFLKPEGDFAGRLIEQAGLKGRRIGGAEISTRHANFFVNVDRASAADVLALVELAEAEVLKRFGVSLTREFEVW
jgi:UDP-N-acetylmuramate dehydrogenase